MTYKFSNVGQIIRISDGATIPADEQNSDYRDYQAWVAAGNVTEPFTFSSEELADYLKNELRLRLDTFAQTRGYDGILSACTYASSKDSQFAAEGQRACDLRDASWTKLFEILEEVSNGTRPAPSSFDEISSELPALSWE